MRTANLRFINVSFSYNSSIEIISSLTIHFSEGWTGVVGPNGSGKSTVAKLTAGLLNPSSGSISGLENATALYCEQETELLPDSAYDFILSSESRAGELQSLLEISPDWLERWPTLSHGERKRMQIGIALWYEPDILVLDEPANHLDRPARDMLISALNTYRSTGIVVSHDRDLIDTLCSNCLFMQPGRTIMRSGGYSEGLKQQALEDRSREKQYLDLREKYHTIKRSAAAVRQREDAKKGSLSKKKISKYDHDAKSRIDSLRLLGKDKQGAKKATLLEARTEQFREQADSAYFKIREVDSIIFHGEKLRRNLYLNKCNYFAWLLTYKGSK